MTGWHWYGRQFCKGPVWERGSYRHCGRSKCGQGTCREILRSTRGWFPEAGDRDDLYVGQGLLVNKRGLGGSWKWDGSGFFELGGLTGVVGTLAKRGGY